MRRSIYDLTNPGWMIASAIAVLTLVGMASIYVTDTHYATGHDGPANAARQSLRVFLGLFLAAMVMRMGYQNLGRLAYPIFLIAVLALVPLVIAKSLHSNLGGLTPPRNGAYRWIALPGFLLQPSELMKVALVLALAWYLRVRKRAGTFEGVLIPVLVTAVPTALILLEPDLGTALILWPALFTMLFLAGARLRYLFLITIVGAVAAPFAWDRLENYQRLRVTAVLLQSDRLRQAVIAEPQRYAAIATRRQALEWSASSGYQLVQSKNAIGSGGVWGYGWGEGAYVENPTLLPDRHNDFIFAVVAHQWGLVGCAIVLCCYAALVLGGARIASMAAEPFPRLLVGGFVTLLASQALVSVAMTMGVLPVTGMTLPFVSYGGSSLLCNFVAIALVLSVSRHRPFLLTVRPFAFGREQTELLHILDGTHPGVRKVEKESAWAGS
jgi:rod shape determining protein RodA